ncbi:MAG: 50S ribosomal protein L22 [Candidatus Spechtbacterales bacterium]
MKQYSATLRYLRISPRKVRLAADLVRNTNAEQAVHQLEFSTKRASQPLAKLMRSAITSARNDNATIALNQLWIKELRVDEGPKLKRFRPVSRGRAHPIEKKTSHITVILEVQESRKTKARNSTFDSRSGRPEPVERAKSETSAKNKKEETKETSASKKLIAKS